MRLSPDEQAMLGGEEGAARQRAMQLLVEYGDALGAETFVNTDNVHLLTSFHFCPEILDANLDIYDMDAFISSSVLLSDTPIVHMCSDGS